MSPAAGLLGKLAAVPEVILPTSKLVRDVTALATSLRLFEAKRSPCGAAAIKLATVIFLVVGVPVVSSTIGSTSALLADVSSVKSANIFLLAMIVMLVQMRLGLLLVQLLMYLLTVR